MKLFKKIAFVSAGVMMAIGLGSGLVTNKTPERASAAAQLLNSFNFLDGGSSGNSAYGSTDIETNVSYAADNPGGTSGTTAWEADYANLSLTYQTRLGGKLVSTVQTDDDTAWANIKTKFTFAPKIEQVEILGVGTFGTAGNVTALYLQSSLNSTTWTTQATTTDKSGVISFSGLNIPAGSYLRFGIALKASTTNSGISFTGIKVYESVGVSKTLSSLAYSGTPTKTTYSEGESFLTDGITVTATYSDSSTDNVTAAVVWAELLSGDTSVVGTYTYGTNSLTVTVTGLTVTEVVPIGNIISGHRYLITAAQSTSGETKHILKAGAPFAVKNSGAATEVFTSAANYSLDDGFLFTKVGPNRYEITSSTDYLSADADNNGLVLGTTVDSWTVTEAVGTTTGGVDYDGVFLQDLNKGRYLTSYAAGPNFRTYNTTTSQPLPAACIVLYDITALEGFADSFNTAIGAVCDADGETIVSSLATAWANQAAAFNGLTDTQKAVFADLGAEGDVAGTTMQKAIAKYEYVAAKYNTQLMASGWDFMSRNIAPVSESSSTLINTLNDSSVVLLIVIISLVSVTTIAGTFYLRKRKYN